MWLLFSGMEECVSLRSDWWNGLRPGQGPGPVCSRSVEREGGRKKKEMAHPPPKPPPKSLDPMAANHCQLSCLSVPPSEPDGASGGWRASGETPCVVSWGRILVTIRKLDDWSVFYNIYLTSASSVEHHPVASCSAASPHPLLFFSSSTSIPAQNIGSVASTYFPKLTHRHHDLTAEHSMTSVYSCSLFSVIAVSHARLREKRSWKNKMEGKILAPVSLGGEGKAISFSLEKANSGGAV